MCLPAAQIEGWALEAVMVGLLQLLEADCPPHQTSAARPLQSLKVRQKY